MAARGEQGMQAHTHCPGLLVACRRWIRIASWGSTVGPTFTRSGIAAVAVAAVLAAIGMRSQDIDAEGMGDKDPVASNATAEGRAQNRRVAIVVSSP